MLVKLVFCDRLLHFLRPLGRLTEVGHLDDFEPVLLHRPKRSARQLWLLDAVFPHLFSLPTIFAANWIFWSLRNLIDNGVVAERIAAFWPFFISPLI